MNMTESGGLSWTNMPPMPDNRLTHAMVAADGRLFVIGDMGVSDMFVYNINNSTWETVPLQIVRFAK